MKVLPAGLEAVAEACDSWGGGCLMCACGGDASRDARKSTPGGAVMKCVGWCPGCRGLSPGMSGRPLWGWWGCAGWPARAGWRIPDPPTPGGLNFEGLRISMTLKLVKRVGLCSPASAGPFLFWLLPLSFPGPDCADWLGKLPAVPVGGLASLLWGDFITESQGWELLLSLKCLTLSLVVSERALLESLLS